MQSPCGVGEWYLYRKKCSVVCAGIVVEGGVVVAYSRSRERKKRAVIGLHEEASSFRGEQRESDSSGPVSQAAAPA